MTKLQHNLGEKIHLEASFSFSVWNEICLYLVRFYEIMFVLTNLRHTDKRHIWYAIIGPIIEWLFMWNNYSIIWLHIYYKWYIILIDIAGINKNMDLHKIRNTYLASLAWWNMDLHKISKWITTCQRGLGSAGYGSFALPNTLRFDSSYQQESVGGHHIPKRVCSARGFNITINTLIFFV